MNDIDLTDLTPGERNAPERAPYTQLKLKPDYRAKLLRLAKAENRSMANMAEVLIDREVVRVGGGS